MKVENPVALRFLLQDELYLLDTDRPLYENRETAEHIIEKPEPETITQAQVPTIQVTKPEVKTPAVTFNYLGKNLKSFLILVHYPGLDFIADVHLTALQNILKRKDLEIDDVAILNMDKYNTTNHNELISFFKPAKLLLLGQAALPQGMAPLALNTPKQLNNYTALYSFSFNEMMESTENKKTFWEQMKTL